MSRLAPAAFTWMVITGVLALPQPAVAASNSQAWSDAAWAAWDGGGEATSVPAVVADAAGQRLWVFVRGSDSGVWEREYASGTWGAWQGLGGTSAVEPAAAAFGPDQLGVFVRGSDGQLWADVATGGVFGGWQPLGGGLGSSPAVVSWAAGRLDVFVRGTDRQLWHKWWDASAWSGWEPLGGVLTSGPVVASDGSGRLDVLVRGTDFQLWHLAWDGAGWTSWQPLGGTLTSGPAAESPGSDLLDIFARGTDGGVWRRSWDGTQWLPWASIGGSPSSGLAAVSAGSGAWYVFGRGQDSAIWRTSSLQSWTSMGMAPSRNVIGDIAFRRQAYALSCEEAALQMAMTHEDIATTQTAILDRIGVDYRSGYYSNGVIRWGDPNIAFVGNPSGSESNLTGYGTYYATIATAARGMGADVGLAGQSMTLDRIYSAALQNHPVIAWVSADWSYHSSQPWLAFDGRWVLYAGPTEHAVVVAGVDADSIYALNPVVGPQWVSKSAFAAAFRSYSNMAVIID